MDLLPRQRGPFVKGVMEALSPERQKSFLEQMPVWEQAFSAYALATNPRFWKKPDEVAGAFLLLRGGGNCDLVCAATGGPSAGLRPVKTLRLEVLHPCCGMGTSVHILNTALHRVLPELGSHSVQVHLEHQVGYDTDPVAVQIAQTWSEAAHSNASFYEQSASDWTPSAQKEGSRMMSTDTHFLMLFASPCNNLTKAKGGNSSSGSGLHTFPSNAVWELHAGLSGVTQVMGTRAAFFSEQVKCAHECDDLDLNKLFGDARSTHDSHLRYGRAKRDRRIRTSPQLPTSWTHQEDVAQVPELEGGWKWRGNATQKDTPYLATAVRGWMANLVASYALQVASMESPRSLLSDYEIDTVMSMYMERGSESRLANRELLLWWMGMEKTGLQEVLQAVLPCHERCWVTTGTAAPPNLGDACGNSRYCENCEHCLKYIGQAWEMYAMTDVVTAWLRRALLHWAGVEDASGAWFKVDPGLEHRCSFGCSKALQT